jgi:arylsulfatase A-like enzyme
MNSRVSLATVPPRAAIIVLHGLGPAFIGGYGNEWIRTGTLDRLCARGVAFDRHYSTTTNPTDAAHLWTSNNPDLIASLNHARIATIRIRDHSLTASVSEWVFDEVVERDSDRPWSLLPIRQTLYPLLEKLPKNAPAFLWVEVDVLTPPWRPLRKWLNYYFVPDEEDDDPPTPWLDSLPAAVAKDDERTFERLQSTFAANVSAMDRSLGKLLAGCRSRGFGKDAMIAVTSDLAFPLGEHGPVGRICDDIQESSVHLPLIVRMPGQELAGHRIESLTQPNDLGDTVADHFGLPGVRANSLFPLMRGEKGSIRDHLIIRSSTAKAVRTADRLLVRDANSSKVYEQPSDRWCVHDVAGNMDDELARLESLLNPAAT